MKDLVGTTQGNLIKSYYNFLKKLYGMDHVERDLEFEKRVAEKFGKDHNKDIDIEVAMGIKTKTDKTKARKERSLGAFVDNFTKVLPEDTTHIKFYGEFVERNNNNEKVSAQKRKDRFAFQEQIRIVKNMDSKRLVRKENDQTKYFEKDDLESFSKLVKFEKHELVL